MSGFEPVGSDITWQGVIITAGVQRFRHADGTVVSREKVWHPGAVGILAIDDEHVWLTRQPREAAGLSHSLEIPAGKLDVPGETPLSAAQRELAEEIGQQAAHWSELKAFYSTPGFSDERIWCYLARDLSPSLHTPADEDERIEIMPWPLAEIDAAIAQCEDSKSLIALLWLALARERGGLDTGS